MGEAVENTVTMVQSGGYEGVDESFGSRGDSRTKFAVIACFLCTFRSKVSAAWSIENRTDCL